MRARAMSMSESIFTIAFEVLMVIIYLREDIFTSLGSSQENDRVVYIAGGFITVFTTLLSIISIILWVYEYAARVIQIYILRLLSNIPDFVGVSGYIIIVMGYLMIFTSFAFFLLFKENHKPLPVALAIISVFCFLGFITIFHIREDHGPEVPEAELEHLLELAAGITNLLFVSLIGSAIDNFRTSKNATSNENSTQLTVHSHFDLPLFFIFVGSLFGIFIMVLISVANRRCSTKIWAAKCLLVIVVQGNVLAGTWELLKGFAILETLPGLVFLLVYTWKVCFHDTGRDLQDDDVQNKLVNLSFTNIAFAGMVAAVGFSEEKKETLYFKFFAFFASSGLVSALIWRLLTHQSRHDASLEMVQRVSCGSTLLFLFLTVVTSPSVVWG